MIILILGKFCVSVVIKKKIHIVTGGPGFGKTMLISHLGKFGYKVGSEVARDLIQEQQNLNGTVLPWKDSRSFQQEVLKRRIAFFNSVENCELAFSDRAIPDQIAFARYHGFKTPEVLIRSANEFRYNKTVFITPPWSEIYINDNVRTESFEKACELHRLIIDVYREFDYTLIDIPCLPIKRRTEFVVNQTSEKNEF